MSRRQRFIIAILIAFGVAAALASVRASNNGSGRSVAPLMALTVAIGVAVVVVIVVNILRGRKHRQGKPSQLEVEAGRLGFAYRPSADSEFHHDFGPLPGIPRRGNVKHVLTGVLEGQPLTIFQHSYVINTGQAVIPVYHTAYVMDAPDWPSVTITGRRFWGRLLYRLGARRGLELEDPAFNAAMKVKTDDEDFALTLINPDMQRFLAEKPDVVWRVHSGCCALVYGGALRTDRIEQSLDRLRRFWSLVPSELSAW